MNKNDTFITKSSSFEGEISAENIIVAGEIMGDLRASSVILILNEGKVKGNIQAPSVYLAEGCIHEGDIYLEDPDIASSSKIDMNQVELKTDEKETSKRKEKEEHSQTRQVSNSSKSN